MGKYLLPAVSVSDDFQAHRRRNSAEPGTDFELAYGSVVKAPYAGTVRVVHATSDGAGGRYVGIDLADGNYFRALHLSKVSCKAGQKVTQGQQIGVSGGSGFGQDRHYGAHVHMSLWVGTDPVKSGWRATTDIVRYSGGGAAPAAASGTQRVAAALAHRRAKPTAAATDLPGPLKKGTVGNFKGWVRGQSVQGNNVWFVGISGNYFWSGGFTSTSTKGLKDLN